MKFTVKYTAEGGYAAQKEYANKLLALGAEYEVESCDVYGCSARYKLVGIEDKFNTCLFDKRCTEAPKDIVNFQVRL